MSFLIRGSVLSVGVRLKSKMLAASATTPIKKLAAFDFDHTIVDDNTDIVARKFLSNDQIPESTKILYRSSGWTVYMREIFKLLHKYRVSESAVRTAITTIKPVDFVDELIRVMVDELNFDVIIISDSNSVFINDWLIAHGLNRCILRVFTNPASYDSSGLLNIDMYHVQTSCKLSTVNLCKGQILDDFVKEQSHSGIEYEQVVYVGDGRNDFCPILRLGTDDLACVRRGYPCAEILTKSADESQKVAAKICVWASGRDILKCLRD